MFAILTKAVQIIKHSRFPIYFPETREKTHTWSNRCRSRCIFGNLLPSSKSFLRKWPPATSTIHTVHKIKRQVIGEKKVKIRNLICWILECNMHGEYICHMVPLYICTMLINLCWSIHHLTWHRSHIIVANFIWFGRMIRVYFGNSTAII